MAGTTAAGAFGGDYDTPEQQVGRFQADRPWESCITICRQWAWKPDDEMKTLDECVRTLVSCAGGDGNLLLNVGPMPTGEIEARQAERLREIGAWLKIHGEAVYGTRGGPFVPGEWGVSTHRGANVYVHVLRWPKEGPVVLPPLERRILAASVVGGGGAEVQQASAGLTVHVAPGQRRPIDTVVRLELDGLAGTLPAR